MAKRSVFGRLILALFLIGLGLLIGWLTDPMPVRVARAMFQSPQGLKVLFAD